MSVKAASALQINLFGEPPSTADIEAARVRLSDAIKADGRRIARLALAWCAFAAVAGVGVAVYWNNAFSGVLLIVTLLSLSWVFINEDHEAEERELFRLTPNSTSHLDDVVAACEFDPQVDNYRRKVVQQGRELMIAEAMAFRHWMDHGYDESCNWAAVRSLRPIEPSESVETEKPALDGV